MAWSTFNRLVVPLIASVAALLVAACDNAVMYKGDGKLVDNGIFAATDRYVLDLGPLDLSAKAARTYQIANLPTESFVVGLELTSSSKAPFGSHPLNPIVAIELQDATGKVLMRRNSPLKEWTWSVPSTNEWAFIYGEGAQETFFTPAPQSTLRLMVEVVRADPTAEAYSSRLVAKTGGWK